MTPKYVVRVIFLAMTAIWVAMLAACSYVPAYPIFGTPAVITLSSIVLSGLTAPVLGFYWGAIAGFVFGWLVPYVNPQTSIGLLTFLTPTMAVLMSSLVLFDRWKEATLLLALNLFVWFLHPFAWYQAMPIITWQYWVVLGFIVIPPVRKFIVKSITSRDPANITIALWCLAWIARIGGDVITGNNIAVWTLGWGTPDMYAYWAPMTIYYAIAESLNCVAGALIGTGVLLALKRTNLSILAIDNLHRKK
ncbi:MAG TPA: hypothetical protein VMW36_03530 [Patescibacteria group bacterium]|nr:hypothetical protein [Patescibacteria group bacterium]